MVDLDERLLSGFSFGCLPNCGLCCFASPRVSPEEEGRLRSALPHLEVASSGRDRLLAARPDGGACHLLRQLSCSAHRLRPVPCREYPVTVHVGTRLQASLVLTCPGVSLGGLRDSGNGRAITPATGFDSELASVRARLGAEAERRLTNTTRRRRRLAAYHSHEGRWTDEEEAREQLLRRRLVPDASEYRPQSLPSVEEGLELLPMFFDRRSGPVAISDSLGGWDLRLLSEEGGSDTLGVFVPPTIAPGLSLEGRILLEGYLRYWLLRDAFLAAVQLSLSDRNEPSVEQAALHDLWTIGSDVMARAAVRSKLRGGSGTPLSPEDVGFGIRATDQDWLDRPTWGERF